MADDLQSKMQRLHLPGSSANHAAAAAVGHLDAATYERESASQGGSADVNRATDTGSEDGDSGVSILELSLRPSQVGELEDVFFTRLDERVPPPDYGLTISTTGEYTRYFCLTFRDCDFDNEGMTTLAGCQYHEVTFEGCTFKGTNHFANIVGRELSYKMCTFDDYCEMDVEHESGKEIIGRAFRNIRLNGDPGEMNKKDKIVEEQQRELDRLEKHPQLLWGIHPRDKDGEWKSPGRGLVFKEHGKHKFYREVYFFDCTFDPEKPTIFDNCVLDGVTFTNCYFSGSLFKNFCAKGLQAVNCQFHDCQYVNLERPENEVLTDRQRHRIINIGESLPEALIETLREKQGQKAWVLADEEDGNYTHKKAEPAKGIVIKDNVPLAPHEKNEDHPPPAAAPKEEKQWDFATKGKGKGRAVESGDESKKSGSTTPAASATPDPPAEEAAPALAPTVFKTFNFEEDPETREETVVTDLADIPQAGNRRGPGFRYRHNPRLEPFYAIGRQMGWK